MSYTLTLPDVLYLEAVSSHTSLVIVDQSEALFLGVVRCGEEHAFVALGLLIGADT